MEFLILLFLVILLVVMVSVKSSFNDKLDALNRQFFHFENHLRKIEERFDQQRSLQEPGPTVEKQVDHPGAEVSPVVESPIVEDIPPVVDVPPAAAVPPHSLIYDEEPKQDIPQVSYFESGFKRIPVAGEKEIADPGKSFFERHPDLEKFIGENLVNKIGIAILVLAIAYFVKYAIDNNWLGPVARVGVGLLCGGILLAVAHYLRKSYHAFSSVLVGGGMAVMYFTITLAYHQFHLLSQSAAFVVLVVVTAFAVLLSLLYDRQELAVIALIGGFSSPFMVSNGSGNYHTLFTYLLLLNTGLLVLAYFKSWRLLNLLAFVLTVIIYAGWLYNLEANTPAIVYRNGFVYASLFYALFFIINIAYNIRENKKFIASDFSILLANTSCFFGTGLYLLEQMHAENYRGAFSISMSAVNLSVTYLLFKNRKVDTNILYLLIGITLTFISLTAPLQLHGNYITLFWASEAVLLTWLYRKSGIRLIYIGSIFIWGAMLISMFMDWSQVYAFTGNVIPIVLNKALLTGAYVSAATYLVGLLTDHNKAIFRYTSMALLFLSGLFEIIHQFQHYFTGSSIYIMYVLLYSCVFAAVLLIVGNRIQWLISQVKIGMIISCIGLYMLTIVNTFSIQAFLITRGSNRLHFAAHWLSSVIIAVMIYQSFRFVLAQKDKTKDFFYWLFSLLLVVFVSVEFNLLVNSLFYTAERSLDVIGSVYRKVGLPILWGFCSFAFMWYGMKQRIKLVRIISLTLFSITLLKLFILDLRDISATGRIASFFCLGVLLLVISFMYQRLKKIIIDNEG